MFIVNFDESKKLFILKLTLKIEIAMAYFMHNDNK